jgi:hypothetical protein
VDDDEMPSSGRQLYKYLADRELLPKADRIRRALGLPRIYSEFNAQQILSLMAALQAALENETAATNGR